MLAKVLKDSDAVASSAFSVPTFGDGKPHLTGISAFTAPSIDSFEQLVTPRRRSLYESNDQLTVDDVLESARAEAERIIAQAEEHGSIIEQAATDNVAHLAEINLESENAAYLADLRLQFADSIVRVSSLTTQITANVENELVHLALQIAKKVVAREVAGDPAIALTLVERSLAKLHNRAIAEVHLNPEDLTFVKEHLDKLDFRGTINLIGDKSITVGGCLIHTETGDIDARIESQFDEIAHGLFN